MRKIHNPSQVLRVVQYRILDRFLNLYKLPDYIYAFERGKSIPVMANIHVGQKTVVSLDIKDFFGSIKQYMVANMFVQIGFGVPPAKVLSELCTYKAYVPQGSLTAPKISNLIAAGTFGPEVQQYCQAQGLNLSIYADDITVSFTKDFETPEARKVYLKEVIDTLTGMVEKFTFKINKEKTKVMERNKRQWVCGAVVNEKVNMKKAERMLLRAIVFNTTRNGVEAEAQKAKLDPEAFLRKYAGRINWLCQLNPDAGNPMKAQFRKVASRYLRKFPNLVIEELAWNSGVEMPLDKIEFEEEMQVAQVDLQAAVASSVNASA